MRFFNPLTGIFILIATNGFTQQNCIPITTVGGSTNNIMLPCGVNCTNLGISVPHIKQTTGYITQSIPYTPYDFTSPSGTELNTLYVDDVFSDVIPLGFNFCFFGQNYTDFLVGSNGLITFDPANAACDNAWDLRTGTPLPYAGGSICNTTPEYYPRASIMGAYADLDPRPVTSPVSKKIEYRLEGSAPCRRMIISYNDIRMYSSLIGCTDLNTFQIVIYEGTGIVEIFVQNKSVCTNWNNGNAIMGMQNWARDQFVAPPGKNATQWTAAGEAYRFLPYGSNSRFVKAELLVNNAVVATGDTATNGSGDLNINFNNFCPANTVTQAVIRTQFSSCDISEEPLYRYDYFTITKTNGFNATAVSSPATCNGATGKIIVNVPSGIGTPPLSYSLNGGAGQSSNIFENLIAGNYTVTVTDAGSCTQTLNVVVGTVTGIEGTASSVPTGCPTASNGSITVTPTTGVAPYTYSLNGGVPQSSPTFNGLAAGTYNITFTDFNGCLGEVSITVAAGPGLTANSSQTNPPCTGINNGTLTIIPTTGTAPYSYSLNGGTPQGSATFTGLGPGTYTISFSDGIGCTGTKVVTLVPTTPLNVTIVKQNVNCFGENNGSISLTAVGGTAPYEYSKDNGANYGSSANFSNLIAGTYTIRIRDFNGCIRDTPITITQPTLLTASAAATPATCNGNDGTITITAGGGTTPYSYSINNGAQYLGSGIFTDSAGTYTIKVKDNHGCLAGTTATITLNDTMRLELGPDTTICEWSNLTLIPQTNAQTSIFNWGPDTGISSTTAQNPVVSPHSNIRYYVNARWGVCRRSDTIGVSVKLKPIANAGFDTIICHKTQATLRGSVTRTSGPTTFLWIPSASVTPATNFIAAAKPDTTQEYVLEVSDDYGCGFKVYDTVMVYMRGPVPADAGHDTVAVTGAPHQLSAGGGIRYVWSPIGPLNNPFIQSPTAVLYGDTRFTVFVQDNAGCIGQDEVFIKVYNGPTYYMANAFSPNGDGLNDIYRPTPVGIVKTDYFRVFSRYGELLFETKQYHQGWDGTFKGKKQPQGTYVWMIKGLDKDGKIVEKKGTFLLIH